MVNKKLIILTLMIIMLSSVTFGCINSKIIEKESNNRLEIIYNQYLNDNSSFITRFYIIHDNIIM